MAKSHPDTLDHPSLPSESIPADHTKSATLSLELKLSRPPKAQDKGQMGITLPVYVWGLDNEGTKFVQKAAVGNISARGALLLDIKHRLECGDLIGISCNGRQARFRIIWTCDTNNKIAAAVQRLESDPCPWEDVLASLSLELDGK